MGTKAQDMRHLIQSWIDASSGRDISLLSRKSGLEYNTVRRVFTGSNPDCQTALALLNVVTDKPSALTYLKEHFPHAAAFHERELTTENFHSDAESLRPYIENRMTFVVLNLAYAGHATKATLAKTYGEFGLEAAESLVAGGKLCWSGERLTPVGDEKFFAYETKNDLVKAVSHIVELSRGDKDYPVAFVGSLNDEENAKAKSIVRESCAALKELFINSKGGRQMVAVLRACDSRKCTEGAYAISD